MSKELKSPVQSTPTPRRKPYVRPACLSEQIFEATALACGKLPGGGGFCSGAPKAS
jgi:hypothetical protein